MKRFALFTILLLCFAAMVYPQTPGVYAGRIYPRTVAPAVCNPANGEIYANVTAGAVGLYSCTAANTWRAVGNVGNQLQVAQGTIIANTPFIQHTATWNNAAVIFTNILSTVTDMASNAASLLMDLRVGAGSIFSVGKAGDITTTAAGHFQWAGRSIIHSHADGNINLTNAADNNFTRLNLGVGGSVAFPGITVSAAVGGQTQGIIITKADGTAAVFADLGAATDGSMIYCSDCTIASPCAAGGTGSLAKRLNGVWVCN